MYVELLDKVKEEDILASYNKYVLNNKINTNDIINKINEFIIKGEDDKLSFNYLEVFAGYCGIGGEDYDYESFNNDDLLIEFEDIVNDLEILIYRNLDKEAYPLALKLLDLKIVCRYYDDINYDEVDCDYRNVLDYDEIINTNFFSRLIAINLYLINKCAKENLANFIKEYKRYIKSKVLNNILIKDNKELINIINKSI